MINKKSKFFLFWLVAVLLLSSVAIGVVAEDYDDHVSDTSDVPYEVDSEETATVQITTSANLLTGFEDGHFIFTEKTVFGTYLVNTLKSEDNTGWVDTFTTNEDGILEVYGFPSEAEILEVQEVSISEEQSNFVPLLDITTIDIDGGTSVLERECTNIDITVMGDSGVGFVYQLVANSYIYSVDGETIFAPGDFIGEAIESNEDGTLQFVNLPNYAYSMSVTVIEADEEDEDAVDTYIWHTPSLHPMYEVRLVEAPDGYVIDFDSVLVIGDVSETVFFDSEAKNVMVHVQGQTGPLSNVSFILYDEDGEIVEEGIINDNETFTGLEIGGEYTITLGRAGFEAITETFEVEDDRERQDVVVHLASNIVRINLTDHVDGAGIALARFHIYGYPSERVATVVSGATATVEGLEEGNYVLVQEFAPRGYIRSEHVYFTVERQETTVAVTNQRVQGFFQINLITSGSREPIPGGQFNITLGDTIIETLTTDQHGRATSRVVDVATFHNGAMIDIITYQIQQTLAPSGFIRDPERYNISLGVLDDETPVVFRTFTMPNRTVENNDNETNNEPQPEDQTGNQPPRQPENTGNNNNNQGGGNVRPGVVQTGDFSRTPIILMGIFSSLGLIAVIISILKRRDRKK